MVQIRAIIKIDLRACNLIPKRKRTLHRSQIKQMNGNDKILAKILHTTPFCFSFTTRTSQKKSRHIILEQLEQLFARILGPLSTTTSHDEGQTSTWIFDTLGFVLRTRSWK
jgi:hypothetical protein